MIPMKEKDAKINTNRLIEANTKLVDENAILKRDNERLENMRKNAINFIDQVLMYEISNFDYEIVYKDLDKLIGILSLKESDK